MLKICSGKFRARLLHAPKDEKITRPTSSMLREAIFNILQGEVEGCSFLDLFAGSGAVGFEALSRDASHVIFVEQDRFALECIKRNRTLLKVEEQSQILAGDVFKVIKALEKQDKQFDCIFIDPPYHLEIHETLMQQLDQSKILSDCGVILLEQKKEKVVIPPLKSLFLHKERMYGNSILYEYRRNFS